VTNVEFSSNVWKRESRAGLALAWGLMVVSLSMGCGGVPKTAYYTLGVPPAPSPSDAKTAAVLGVEHLRAPLALRDDRVLYYQSATQMNFYEHSRWGADPATMLTEYAAQWLGSSGAFAHVCILPSRQRVDYTLGGTVLSFEEVDYGGGTKARVGLDLFLMRTLDRKVIWTGKQQVDAPLQGAGVEGVATALSASTSQLLREMTPGLIAQVEQDFKASAGQTH
jgi:ABC-type uncharacterized transport system auxiliary subunit